MMPGWMPECVARAGLRALGLVLTVALWPLVTAACFADLLTMVDPRLEDL